jgi:membrane protein YdbS with pleckstrin-like domain
MIILFPITIAVYIYQSFYYSKKRYLREIYKNYIKTQNWIFFITKKYVLFRHIKWIKSTKYPFTNTWKLYLNVAWETEVATNNKSQWNLIILLFNLLSWWKFNSQTTIFSNSVDMKYIKNVFENHDMLDNILNWQEINKEILLKSKQSIANTIFPMVILIFPIIFIPIAVWITKVRYWNFEKNRVVYGSWIIYKKRQSILYHRFNFIDLKRWFLNKMFKNWTINIYTLWSSSVDMSVVNTKNYNEVYKLLKK